MEYTKVEEKDNKTKEEHIKIKGHNNDAVKPEKLKKNGIKKEKNSDGTTVRIKKVKKNNIKKKLIVFIVLAAFLLFVSIFPRIFCPYDPYEQNLSQALQPPSHEHLIGTDRYGRDLLSRVIMGSQASIYSTLLLVLIVSVIGTVFGVFCGWKGGKVERWSQDILRAKAKLQKDPSACSASLRLCVR